MQVERRALVRGVDRSAVLRGLNVPVVSAGEHPVMAATQAIDRLPPAQQRRLESLGLVEGYGDPANGGRRHMIRCGRSARPGIGSRSSRPAAT